MRFIYLKSVLTSFVITFIYFSLLPPQALEEDILNYYLNFNYELIDFDTSINIRHEKVTFASINIIPIFLYTYLSSLPFYVFVFINQLIIVFMYIIYSQIIREKLFFWGALSALSPNLLIFTSYTWRQALSTLVCLFALYSYKKTITFLLIGISTIFIHAIGAIFFPIFIFKFYFNIRNNSFLAIISPVLAGVISAYYLNLVSASGSIIVEIQDIFKIENYNITTLLWLIISLFFFDASRRVSAKVKNNYGFTATNDYYMLSFLLSLFLFNSSPVFFSRIMASVNLIFVANVLRYGTRRDMQKVSFLSLLFLFFAYIKIYFMNY